MDEFAPLPSSYQESRYAFHSLIVGRIYHEDMLFAQRSYVLLGVHAFLMAAFTVVLTGKDSGLASLTAIALTVFGSLLGTFQASFGRQTSRAIGFWREYLRLIEQKWHIPFDHLQYDFYALGKVETPFGVIRKSKSNQRALYQTYSRARFLTSITTVVGLLFPSGLALFWALALAFLLHHLTHRSWVAAAVFSLFVLLEIHVLRRSVAEAKSSASPTVTRAD